MDGSEWWLDERTPVLALVLAELTTPVLGRAASVVSKLWRWTALGPAAELRAKQQGFHMRAWRFGARLRVLYMKEKELAARLATSCTHTWRYRPESYAWAIANAMDDDTDADQAPPMDPMVVDVQ